MKASLLIRAAAIAGCVAASVFGALQLTAPQPIGVAQVEAAERELQR